jgi:phage baseplate assembly protein gpV
MSEPREQAGYERDANLGEAADGEQGYCVAINAEPGDDWSEHEGTRVVRRARGQGFAIDVRSNGGTLRLQGGEGGVTIAVGQCRIVIAADGTVTVEASSTATVKAPEVVLDAASVKLGGAGAIKGVVYAGHPCPVNPLFPHMPGSTTVRCTP